MFLEGCFIKSGASGKAGGYSEDVLKKAVEDFNKHKDEYSKFGSFGDRDNAEIGISVPMGEITHEVVDVSIEHGDLFGKIQLLDTPKGKIVKEMLNVGAEFEVAPLVEFDDSGNIEIKRYDIVPKERGVLGTTLKPKDDND